MSLLIPTERDFEDAREGRETIPVYQETIAKLNKRSPITNELEFPWDFEFVPGFFKQADPNTDDLNFNYVDCDFGITKPWSDIVEQLNELNINAKDNECYKLLFLARHGQGNHNIVVSKYGIGEWRRKWHELERDGDLVYGPDPVLTEVGINQAKENNQAWKEQLAKNAPIPSKFIVSPLQRSCNTLLITWKDIFPENTKPVIVENVREMLGFHLCNKRSNKTTILERFGKHGFITEPGFEEEDTWYVHEVEETAAEQCLRTNRFMQQLFDEQWDSSQSKTDPTKDQVVSVTSHGGTIKTFLGVIGHRAYTIPTGGMIPVVVKGTRH
ncbi:phosphoglycerate mutase-like protein [Hyphopichia burtonii NRRL Y-1933]|uniref:Phosphoglycerate mutase-like protein n=1 Tax=Hyphopichia burtonii NRRL Y-1933 TaxID=984485 RepID=A0A1E4RM15_9ASCO|nr:phosphoglycerate mutase-like protein [Hyphopichia burtonii NRRL Y-1933]ODV68307.1 phosphoglycerate mutase-like protein [Hyphopichia burtonii NRRL Y-1933]